VTVGTGGESRCTNSRRSERDAACAGRAEAGFAETGTALAAERQSTSILAASDPRSGTPSFPTATAEPHGDDRVRL
jgi:hypothetical protein